MLKFVAVAENRIHYLKMFFLLFKGIHISSNFRFFMTALFFYHLRITGFCLTKLLLRKCAVKNDVKLISSGKRFVRWDLTILRCLEKEFRHFLLPSIFIFKIIFWLMS